MSSLFLALNGGDKENKEGHLVILPGAPHYDTLLLLAGKKGKLGFTGFTGFFFFFSSLISGWRRRYKA